MAAKKNGKGRAHVERMMKGKGERGGDQPHGFRKVETHMVGFWKPEIVGQSIQGVVGEAVDGTGPDGKPNTWYLITLTSDEGHPIYGKDGRGAIKKIEPQVGMIVGVSGTMAIRFLRGREGKEVYLSYTGLGEKQAGKNPPKLFSTYERDA